MSTYELDDDLVRAFLCHDASPEVEDRLFDALRAQLSLPAPTKIGAVVRTSEGVAVPADPRTDAPWVLHPTGTDYVWREPGQIGKITEVLSEGADL